MSIEKSTELERLFMDILISQRIKELRNTLELTQKNFADKLGITNAHISKIEKGKTSPSDALIKLISKEYDVNENWLKFGIGDMFKEMEPSNEEIFENLMVASTKNLNKSLRSDNEKIRMLSSELNLIFTEIIDIENINDDRHQIEYLEKVKLIFLILNEFGTSIKKYAFSDQDTLPFIVSYIKDTYKEKIESAMNDFFE